MNFDHRYLPKSGANDLRHRIVQLRCLLFIVLLAGCSLPLDPSTVGPDLVEPVEVKAVIAEVKRDVLTIEMSGAGVVVPSKTEYAYFQIDGKLGEVAVRQGDYVKKGDVLLRLDSGNFELERMQLQLAVENMQEELMLIRQTGNDDGIRLGKIDLEIAQKKLARLLDIEHKRVLVAPSEGIITFMDNDVRVGGVVTAFHEIVGIAGTDELQVQYIGDFSAYTSYINIGMPVMLDYKGARLHAVVAVTPWNAPVELFPNRVDVFSKMLLFEITDEIPPDLMIGTNVEFTIALLEKQGAIIIPRGALRSYQGRDYVLVDDGNTLREVDVQRGIVKTTEVEIIAGLEVGQHVVVNQ